MQNEIAMQALVKAKNFKKIFREFDTKNKY
jgi:hypothetical protein